MLSTCPNCLNQVNHEDHLFEVQCECGTKFNPFLTAGDMPAMSGLDFSGVEPSNENMARTEEKMPPLTDLSLEPAAQPTPDYSESNALFQELRDFGEALVDPSKAVSPATSPAVKPAEIKKPVESAAVGLAPLSSDWLMTSGDQLAGFAIEAYYSPISTWATVSTTDSDPMSAAYQALWSRATTSGANAVIGVRWSLSPDFSRALVTGHPVRVAKLP